MSDTNIKQSPCERTILHTLKTGFLKMNVSRSASVIRKKIDAEQCEILCHHDHQRHLKMRRGSSMSDLEKLSQEPMLDLVRSTTTDYQLSVSLAETLSQSPILSRSLLSSNTTSIRG